MDKEYRELWAAVLKQAIEDAQKYIGSFAMEKAHQWFKNESDEVGSFLWICSILDLAPESIKRLGLSVK